LKHGAKEEAEGMPINSSVASVLLCFKGFDRARKILPPIMQFPASQTRSAFICVISGKLSRFAGVSLQAKSRA
jgi:hypothetical protein